MPEPAADPAFFCAQNPDGVITPQDKTPLQAADAQAAAAPFLFSEAEIGAEKLEAVGEFSGERLLARRPETYRAVVRMLAEGLSMSSIARALGVSRNTIAAVRDREGYSIEQSKKDLLATIRRGSQAAAERVVELVPHIQSAKDAAITLAVLVDKAQLLSGEATTRVERVEVNQDKLAEMLASLPVLEAEVVPADPATTGPSDPAPEQKGPASSALTDSRSDGFSYAQPPASATLSTTSAPAPSAAGAETTPAPADFKGGEGVADFAGPPSYYTHQTPQKILGKGESPAPEDQQSKP